MNIWLWISVALMSANLSTGSITNTTQPGVQYTDVWHGIYCQCGPCRIAREGSNPKPPSDFKPPLQPGKCH